MAGIIRAPALLSIDVEQTPPVRIVAISGSLRRSSSNGALIAAAASLSPQGVTFTVFPGLPEIPPFNPDQDGDPVPVPVRGFRGTIAACDAVLISSPEYAHGVPGVLKNALDWIVGSGELVDKPVAVLNASPRATHAWQSLVETLTVMSARVIRDASVTVSLRPGTIDARAILEDGEMSTLVRSAIDALVLAARNGSPGPTR